MLLSPIFCLNLTILNSFAEKKIFFFILFQIFSANPGFWEYFLRTRFAESTTFSTSDPIYEKLHPIYEQTTSQLRGRRVNFFKNAKFLLIKGKFWENTGTGVIIFCLVLCLPSFVLH